MILDARVAMLNRRMLIAAAAVVPFSRLAAAQTADGAVFLEARKIDVDLGAGGGRTPLWGYGEPWPPIIRAKQGVEFNARISNTLGQPVTLHWFGVRGPAEVMSLEIAPGLENAVDCTFTPPDAGTFWLGPLANSSRLREMGLYAAFIVEEAAPLNLPELTLVFDDWRLTEDGNIEEASFGNLEDAIAQGRLGNWFTVNGRYLPHFSGPAAQAMRLRLLNVANVRTMTLQFKGTEPLVLSRDGQPVEPAPIGPQGLALQPGQRADVVIPPDSEMVTIAIDLFEDVLEVAYIDRNGSVPSGAADRLPPNPLSEPAETAARRIPLVLEGGEKGGLKSALLHGEQLDLRALLEKGFAWAINGVAGLGSEPWASFALGETAVIEAENRTAFEQPICIHGHVWRPETGGGWTDTAVVPAGGKLNLLFVADNPGGWGLHSTIAERMDSGLITSFTVV